jgi:hypothetical protein
LFNVALKDSEIVHYRLSERRCFFSNILFGRLRRRNVSGFLLLLARQLLNVTPKDSEIVHYCLKLLL